MAAEADGDCGLTCEQCAAAAHDAFATAYRVAWRSGYAAGRRSEREGLDAVLPPFGIGTVAGDDPAT